MATLSLIERRSNLPRKAAMFEPSRKHAHRPQLPFDLSLISTEDLQVLLSDTWYDLVELEKKLAEHVPPCARPHLDAAVPPKPEKHSPLLSAVSSGVRNYERGRSLNIFVGMLREILEETAEGDAEDTLAILREVFLSGDKVTS